MKIKILAFISILFILSCSKQNQFPIKKSVRILQNTNTQSNSILIKNDNSKTASLELFVKRYYEKEQEFNLDEFISTWKGFKVETNFSELTNNELLNWIEITGFLLELTGETLFAEELEKAKSLFSSTSDELESFVFTKDLDNIYVNLFQDQEINYTHTLGGEVKIKQETDYPNSGSVKLHFGMTERQYIELNIRIPIWAEGATVTVKKVKYFTAPGEYCKIAKKWKEDDLVEIEFPIEKKPKD